MTKGDLVNAAFSRARISGLTVQPTADDVKLALEKLEDMAAHWESRNMRVGYAFEDSPNPSTPHNIPREHVAAFKANLAVLLLSDYGKEAPAPLIAEAQGTLSALASATAVVKPVPHPSRAPRGRVYGYPHFHSTVIEAPASAIRMVVGEVKDFTEHFDNYLMLGESLTSYTLEADSGLTVLSESLSTPDVNYRLKAEALATGTPAYRSVKITVTTSSGRVEVRTVNFEVADA